MTRSSTVRGSARPRTGLGLRLLALALLCLPAGAARAGRTPPPGSNPIPTENARAGTSAWQIPLAPAHAVEGYLSEVSVLPGQVLHFHISTQPAARYRIELFRLGWYGGAGGRLVACLPSCRGSRQGTAQPFGSPDPSSGYLAARWPVTDTSGCRDRG